MESLSPDLLKVISLIDAKILILLLKIFVAGLVCIMLKNIAENIYSYFEFRSNKYVCIGRKVDVDGFQGVIVDISPRFIIVANNKETKLIVTSLWKNHNWSFHNNIMSRNNNTK